MSTPPAQIPRVTPRGLRQALPVLLLRASHPRQAVVTAAAMAAAALLSSRPWREVGLVFVTVLVGQALLGWHNDLVDRHRDHRHDTPGKPLGQGLLDTENTWFVIACAALLVIPLSISAGVPAGGAYLASLVVGLFGNLAFRRTWLSFAPWALSFALYPAYLSYGGWAGLGTDSPPQPAMTALAAVLGVVVHVLRGLPGLVPDHQDGFRSLPLLLALRLGAPRALYLTTAVGVVVVVAMLVTGQQVGLRR